MADVILVEFRGKTDKFVQDSKVVTASVDKSNAALDKFEKNATQAYNKAGASANKFSQATNKVGQTFNTLGSSLGPIAASFGLAFGAQKVIEFGKASVDAFIEAEANAKKLAFAVKNIAGESEASFNRLIGQSAQLQQVSIFSDDDIQKAQTAFLQYGLTTAQVEKLTPAIINLASATGESLSSAQERVLSGINGQTKGLKDVGLQFKDTGDKMKNFEIILNGLNDKFEGASADAMQTTEGQLKNLKNQFGELQETIGGTMIPIFNELFTSLNKINGGDTEGGVAGLFSVFDKLTTHLQFMPGPLAGIIRGFKEATQAVDSFKQGDILGGIGDSLEASANIISFGVYGSVKQLIGGTEELLDKTTGYEKAIQEIIQASEAELKVKRDLIEAQGGNTAEFDKYVASVREAQITQTFKELAEVLEITEQQYKALTDISDKYGRSAAINSSLIMDIKNATENDLNVAFEKFNKTLGVTREDFDAYTGKVKDIKSINKELGDSVKTNVVGPYDQLTKQLAAVNKQILDYITLGQDATQLDRIRYRLTNDKNKVDEESKRLEQSHIPVKIENANLTATLNQNMKDLTLSTANSIPQWKAVNLEFEKGSPQKYKQDIEDLQKQLDEISLYLTGIGGVFGSLSGAIQNMFGDGAKQAEEFLQKQQDALEKGDKALADMYGKAAQDSIAFARFQQSLTLIEVGFAQAGAIAKAIESIVSGNPLQIISGIGGIIAAVGTLFGTLFNDLKGASIPAAPSFFDGTHDTGTGGNVDGRGGFWSILHPHEGVLNRDANKDFMPFVKAANMGKGMSYIKDTWIAPALEEQKKNMEKSFAERIAASMVLQSGGSFDDYRLWLAQKENNGILKNGFTELINISKNKPKRGGYA